MLEEELNLSIDNAKTVIAGFPRHSKEIPLELAISYIKAHAYSRQAKSLFLTDK